MWLVFRVDVVFCVVLRGVDVSERASETTERKMKNEKSKNKKKK